MAFYMDCIVLITSFWHRFLPHDERVQWRYTYLMCCLPFSTWLTAKRRTFKAAAGKFGGHLISPHLQVQCIYCVEPEACLADIRSWPCGLASHRICFRLSIPTKSHSGHRRSCKEKRCDCVFLFGSQQWHTVSSVHMVKHVANKSKVCFHCIHIFKQCWVVLTQIWVKYGQTQMLG